MEASPLITAIICTHNPRTDYFARTLQGLKRQILPRDSWDLVVVDNASTPPVSEAIFEGASQHSRVIHEEKPGKVNAMIAAAPHVRGEWVVFVDDDNVLAPDYLVALARLSAEFPRIGVFSASIEGEFETPVPDWAESFLSYLAIRPLDRAYWGNIAGPHIGPIGAGMCVRRPVYDAFVDSYRSGKVEASLGRTAGSLAAGTDDTVFMDLAFPQGYGCGAFPELRMTHLISSDRLEFDYMKRLVRDISRSHALLEQQREPVRQSRRLLGMVRQTISSLLRARGNVRRILLARSQGKWAAYRSAER